MELERSAFEPIISEAVELNDLEAPVILSFLNWKRGAAKHRTVEIRTCVGDIYKIVNMLHDYARLLEEAVSQWELTGFHRATYEVHAEQCRKIARKYAAAIGYDYDKAVKTCKKKSSRKKADDDIGEDALVLASKGSTQKKEKGAKENVNRKK